MTIGTLAARILADASGIKAGMGLTRDELKITRQAFLDSATDADKLNIALAQLETARGKGAFASEEQYAAAVRAVREELDPTVKLQREYAAEQMRLADEAAAAQTAAIDEIVRAEQAATEQRMAAGKALADSLRTPEEQRNVRLREAKELLDQAAISQETYNRAAREIQAERWQALGTNIRNAAVAVGAVSGAMTAGLVLTGRNLLESYAGAEAAQKKLTAAMTAAGTESTATMASYQAFAKQMQAVTTTEDDAALAMLQTAESLGVSGTAAERAVKNAIALQAALGIDAESAMKMTSALEQGSTSLLTRYLPALKAVEGDAAKAAMAQDLLGKMFSTAEAEATTYAGSAMQLSNAYGDLREEFGAIVAEGLQPFIQSATGVVQSLTEMSDGTKQLIAYTGFAVTGLTSFITTGAGVVASAGQMTVWYGALQKSATGAKVAQIALNSAIGVGYVAAAAAAVGAGYMIGQSLYSLTDAAETNAAALAELKSGMETISTLDFTGASKESLDQYIASTERQIEKIQQHNAELRQSQAWWNFWQANKDLIGSNTQQIDVLNDAINRAKKEQASTATPAVGADTTAATDAVGKLTAKLQEQAQTAGMTADAIEYWKLQQQGATAEQLNAVAAMQRQAAASAAQASLTTDTYALVDSLRQQAAETGKTEAEVQRLRLAARGLSPEWLALVETLQTEVAAAEQLNAVNQHVEQITTALQEQIVTAGMTADEIERWKLAQAGANAEQLASVAALQQQAAAAREQVAVTQEAADAAKQAKQAELDEQKALTDSIKQTSDRLREQIATFGMSAEEAELAKMAAQGASASEIREIKALQDQLAALQAQKEAMRRTDTTVSAGSLADAYDAAQRAREAMQKTEEPKPLVDRYAGPVEQTPVVPEPIALPPAPDLPPIPVEIQTAWADIPLPPIVPTLTTAIEPTWTATPAAPVVEPIAAAIQPDWESLPPAPVAPFVPAEIQTAWSDIPLPPIVPALETGIDATWQPLPPATELPPVLSTEIAAAWEPLPEAPAVPPIETEVAAVWNTPPPAVDVTQPPGPESQTTTEEVTAEQNERKIALMEQQVALLSRMAEEMGLTVQEVKL